MVATRALRLRSQSNAHVSDAKDKVATAERIAGLAPWPKNLPDGLCKGHPSADSFSHPLTEDDLSTAQTVCAACPIRLKCLEIGVERGDDGVYGGELLYRGAPSVLPKYRRRKITEQDVETG